MKVEDHETVAMAEMIELLALNETNPDTESATVRALRAQQAVQQSYRNQVLLAARAVADRIDDDSDPRHAAARVVAAVARLEADGFRRPVLPGAVAETTGAGTAPTEGPEDGRHQWGPPAA